MLERHAVQENFSIQFDGPAFERHEISASALAQSLLALDGLARRSAEAAYGKGADIDIKVKGDFRPGSFIVNMLVQHSGVLGAAGGAVTVLTGSLPLPSGLSAKRSRMLRLSRTASVSRMRPGRWLSSTSAPSRCTTMPELASSFLD